MLGLGRRLRLKQVVLTVFGLRIKCAGYLPLKNPRGIVRPLGRKSDYQRQHIDRCVPVMGGKQVWVSTLAVHEIGYEGKVLSWRRGIIDIEGGFIAPVVAALGCP